MSAEESKYEDEPRKKIAEPPLNILFNPSIVGKKNVWDINVSLLLQMLLNLFRSNREEGPQSMRYSSRIVIDDTSS